MPWSVTENHSECPTDTPIAVVKDSDGSVAGCHATLADAHAQIAALYASENDDDDHENISPIEYQRFAIEPLINDERRAELLPRIQKRFRGDIDDEDIVIVPVQMSSTRLDMYFTWMDETSLTNFRDQSIEGVAVQDSHNTERLSIGKTIDARLNPIDDQDDRAVRAVAEDERDMELLGEFYTVRGLSFGGSSSDQIVRGINAGIVTDGSVGFYGGFMECNLCGEDVRDWWDCLHIPGLRYLSNGADPDLDDEDEEVMKRGSTNGILCTARNRNMNLAEFSMAYKGATPSAGIMKAERLFSEDRVSETVLKKLEHRYHIRMARPRRRVQGVGVSKFPRNIVSLTPEVDKKREFETVSAITCPTPEPRSVPRSSSPQNRGASLIAALESGIEAKITDDMSRPDIVADMADAAGIESGTVNNILNGTINCPPLERLEGFAEVLDVSLQSLIDAATQDGCGYEQNNATTQTTESTETTEPTQIDKGDTMQQKLTADQRTSLIRLGASQVEDDDTLIAWSIERLIRQTDEIKTLKPLARHGEAFFKAEVEETIRQYTRAGIKVDETELREELTVISLDELQRRKVAVTQIGDARFAPGRSTVDDDETENPPSDNPSADRNGNGTQNVSHFRMRP